MLPKYRKKGANLPLFAQGRGDWLRNGQLEQVGLLAIGQRYRSFTFFQNGKRWIGFIG